MHHQKEWGSYVLKLSDLNLDLLCAKAKYKTVSTAYKVCDFKKCKCSMWVECLCKGKEEKSTTAPEGVVLGDQE